MKKLASRVLIALLLCVMLSTTAFADMGPKPSVEITIEGLNGRECCATLLSVAESTGPSSASNVAFDPRSEPPSGDFWPSDAKAFYCFSKYEDPDGLYFLGEVFELTGGSFTWGYYPPTRFRVALFFPDTGEIVTGELLESYAFASSYRASLLPDGSLSPFEKTSSPLKQIPSFLLRVAATILIELLVAGLFRYWELGAAFVILRTNLATQLLLNLALAFISHLEGPSGFFFLAYYLFLELLIFGIEAAIYAKKMPEYCPEHPGRGRAVLYALAANAASFGLGLWLAKLLPFMF